MQNEGTKQTTVVSYRLLTVIYGCVCVCGGGVELGNSFFKASDDVHIHYAPFSLLKICSKYQL